MGSAEVHRPTSALLRGLLSVAVWSLYAVALFAPALKVRLLDTEGDLPGWEALVFGWMPGTCIPWSANLLLLVGWIALLCGRYRSALWLGIAAALAGFTTLGLGVLVGWETLLVGYFVWQASLLLFALGSWTLWRKSKASARGGLGQSESEPVV
jgi:hypothetical protein